MAKRLSRQEKWDKAIVDLVNQMFIIAGHNVTYDDILGKEKWFMEYTMTVEQGEEFKAWGKKYLMKNLNLYAKTAEREMAWFSVQYGLKYSNWDEYYESQYNNTK